VRSVVVPIEKSEVGGGQGRMRRDCGTKGFGVLRTKGESVRSRSMASDDAERGRGETRHEDFREKSWESEYERTQGFIN